MAKNKFKLPSFTATPSNEPLEKIETPSEEVISIPEETLSEDFSTEDTFPYLDHQVLDIVFNPETKTWDRVFIKFNVQTGQASVVKIEKGHPNPLVMVKEMSQYFLNKLVVKSSALDRK